ncbi:conserved protein of unknown function [Limnospira indica PCC 8005]|uniref:Uncharacterized protein n=1 Tax=Limnospira indica PCC 8005 TaxID=376219 RepID=A0A9P1NZF0_9CYAN|nr:conserved protein of unknown function [Limnospira indica PCC 8005]
MIPQGWTIPGTLGGGESTPSQTQTKIFVPRPPLSRQHDPGF